MKLNMDVIANHPEHTAIYKLCIAGVGFLKDGKNKNYEFISHDGNYIGEAPPYRVEPFIAFMKRRFGILRDHYPYKSWEYNQPPITFGWQNLVDNDTLEQWMKELSDEPLILY